MKVLLILMLLSLIGLMPFVFLRRPWAVSLWRRIKAILVIYAVIIATAGILRLIVAWDSIYG